MSLHDIAIAVVIFTTITTFATLLNERDSLRELERTLAAIHHKYEQKRHDAGV